MSEFEPIRWWRWRVVDASGSVWCETSDEDDARRTMRLCTSPVLQRLCESVERQREWRDEPTEGNPMTDPNYTAICLLVDRSGSMKVIQKSAQDSINEFVNAQKEHVGRTTIRIVQFDAPRWENEDETWYLVHCPSTAAADVPPFQLYPRGMTALYDAMARAIDEFGAELAALPEGERPGTVVFAALTDGQENSSREHTGLTIRETVEQQTGTYGWHFIYLGANQDAILEGEKMGIPGHSSITYAASAGGTRAVMDSTSEAINTARSGGPVRFTEAQRRKSAQN